MYCSQTHPAESDTDADRWCELYHRVALPGAVPRAAYKVQYRSRTSEDRRERIVHLPYALRRSALEALLAEPGWRIVTIYNVTGSTEETAEEVR
jgi:hypothetical protein